MEEIDNTENLPKPRKKGKAPTIVPKKITDWLNSHDRNTYVNNYKKGGGHDPWNK